MSSSLPAHGVRDVLTSYYWCDEAMRSRSVSDVVLTATLALPAPPARLLADWERETRLCLGLEPGDVEELPLARARMRWPDYKHCVQAVSDWTQTLGLPDLLATCEIALMTCRGARYHHDGAQYGAAAFCNLFLSEDKGLDLHFPVSGQRIPLVKGTVVIFDTGQPHAVIERGSSSFHAADFPFERDCTQVFLTWELAIANAELAQALGVTFDISPANALLLHEEQVWLNGASATVCPASGLWLRAD